MDILENMTHKKGEIKMLKRLIKKYGLKFDESLSEEEKKQKMIEFLKIQDACSQSVLGSMEYVRELEQLKKEGE